MQAAVLVIVGVAIGLADSRIRPIRLGIAAPTAPEGGQAGTDRGPGAPKAGDGETAAPPSAGSPAAGSPAPAIANDPPPAPPPVAGGGSDAAPAAFRPTTKEELASKPFHITLEEGFEMHQLMGAVFLDARNAEEFAAGHVQGAHLASLSRFRTGDVPQILSDIPKDHPIVVYCSGGADCEASEDLALHLNGIAFFNVKVLHDGIVGWQAVGYPVEIGAGQ